jgi:AraC-like DNA-binding protein
MKPQRPEKIPIVSYGVLRPEDVKKSLIIPEMCANLDVLRAPWSTEKQKYLEHHLCLNVGIGPVKLTYVYYAHDAICNQRRVTETIGPGAFLVTPACHEVCWQLHTTATVLSIRLSAQLVKRIAQESLEMDPSRLDFRHELPARDPFISSFLQRLCKSETSNLFVESAANILAETFLRNYLVQSPKADATEPELTASRKRRLRDIIHSVDVSKLQLKWMAAETHLSLSATSKLFTEEFGESFRELLKKRKLELIESRIREPGNLADVAKECGFVGKDGYTNFVHFIRNARHCTPTELQQRLIREKKHRCS